MSNQRRDRDFKLRGIDRPLPYTWATRRHRRFRCASDIIAVGRAPRINIAHAGSQPRARCMETKMLYESHLKTFCRFFINEVFHLHLGAHYDTLNWFIDLGVVSEKSLHQTWINYVSSIKLPTCHNHHSHHEKSTRTFILRRDNRGLARNYSSSDNCVNRRGGPGSDLHIVTHLRTA